MEDGGGVMPDVEIASLKTNDLIKALDRNRVIFDFATDFFYKNDFGAVSDFSFSDTDYTAFKGFAKKADFTFKTDTEKLLEEQLNADETLLGSEVQNSYKDLLLTINKGKNIRLGHL